MIALASDHVGIELKKELMALLDEMGFQYKDYGAHAAQSSDYPVFAARACRAVVAGECERGILICGTGIGISIAANKMPGIRCAVCSESYTAMLSRLHNDANMLALGARVIGVEVAKMIARLWLTTDFEGDRHQRRVDQITCLERGMEIE